LPPSPGGQRRLRLEIKAVFFAYCIIFQQWFLKQSILRRIGFVVGIYLVITIPWYAAFHSNACGVLANGSLIAIAADENSARKAVGDLVKFKSSQTGWPVEVLEKIKYKGIRINKEDVPSQEALQEELANALTFKTMGAAILVNGEQKVLLKDVQDAEALLAWLKAVYPVESGDQLGFKEKVEVVETLADLEYTLDFATAQKQVLLGTNKILEYKVKDGDNLWDIARAVKIDMDQIVFTNPGLDPENLEIDQVLYLSKEAPLITVMATRETTVDEKIPCPVDVRYDDKLLLGEKEVITEGVPGEKTVTYRITRENGFETEREILSQVVKSEPTTEVVVKGSITMVASRGSSVRLAWPCDGGIVSPFGMRWGRMHEGIDLDAGYGSDVVAVAGGTVVSTGWDGGYGYQVQISHGGGLVTRYAHLSRILVSDGESVDRGEVIGLVGSTGNSTGPHLHFETIVGGEPRDPTNYLP
jgi:murein DD-endopeptidase MepM/ murein hydrolase activator NlpD